MATRGQIARDQLPRQLTLHNSFNYSNSSQGWKLEAVPKGGSYVVSVYGWKSPAIFIVLGTLNPMYLANNEAVRVREARSLGNVWRRALPLRNTHTILTGLRAISESVLPYLSQLPKLTTDHRHPDCRACQERLSCVARDHRASGNSRARHFHLKGGSLYS